MSVDKQEPKKKTKKVMGRPRIEFTDAQWKTIDKACEIFCTKEEIANLISVSEDTLEKRIKEKHGVTFTVYYGQKSVGGRQTLRRKQYEMAKSGDRVMLLWLGKNVLGQKDKVEHSGDEQSPITLAYPMVNKEVE